MKTYSPLAYLSRFLTFAVLWAIVIFPWTVDLTQSGKKWFIGTGLVLATVACVVYLYDMLSKKGQSDQTLPHPVMWGFWTAIGVVNVIVSWLNHPGPGIIIPAYYLLLQLIIFRFSLKKEYGKEFSRWQILVAFASVIAFAVWQLVPGVPAWAVAVAVVSFDALVSLFQVKSSWDMPWHESTRGWVLSAPAAAMGIYGLSSHEFAAAAYPTYLAAFITAVASAQLLSPILKPNGQTYNKEARVHTA